MKLIFKIIGILIVAGMIAYLFFYLNLWPFARNTSITPENTFSNFINAIEGNDPAVASQFFVETKQPQWLRTLEIYKNQDMLKPFALELKGYTLDWKRTTQTDGSVTFEISLPDGKKSTITFKKQGDSWKIESL